MGRMAEGGTYTQTRLEKGEHVGNMRYLATAKGATGSMAVIGSEVPVVTLAKLSRQMMHMPVRAYPAKLASSSVAPPSAKSLGAQGWVAFLPLLTAPS